MTHRIVVLGAGYAGLGAAKRIARRLHRDETTVTLVNVTSQFVERIRLHQVAAGQRLRTWPLSDLLADAGVELVVAQVTGIDVERQTVALNAPPHTVDYDTLVYALGSTADVGTVPGAAENCFTVAAAAEAMRLQPRAAGLAVDRRGRLIVDDTLRSASHQQVYGIGDAAAALTPGGTESRMSCQTGMPMGQHVAGIIADRLTGREPKPSRLRYVWTNISLGRYDGVTQFTHADDSPRNVVLTGRAAARFKEFITRSTVAVLRHPGPYRPTRRVARLPTSGSPVTSSREAGVPRYGIRSVLGLKRS